MKLTLTMDRRTVRYDGVATTLVAVKLETHLAEWVEVYPPLEAEAFVRGVEAVATMAGPSVVIEIVRLDGQGVDLP